MTPRNPTSETQETHCDRSHSKGCGITNHLIKCGGIFGKLSSENVISYPSHIAEHARWGNWQRWFSWTGGSGGERGGGGAFLKDGGWLTAQYLLGVLPTVLQVELVSSSRSMMSQFFLQQRGQGVV